MHIELLEMKKEQNGLRDIKYKEWEGLTYEIDVAEKEKIENESIWRGDGWEFYRTGTNMTFYIQDAQQALANINACLDTWYWNWRTPKRERKI